MYGANTSVRGLLVIENALRLANQISSKTWTHQCTPLDSIVYRLET